VEVFPQDSVPMSNIARELVGSEYGVGVCLLFVDAAPGRGPSLHKHPYEEIVIVTEGEATFFGASGERVVRGGEIVIVPAEEPHGFRNTGDGPLKQIDIHVSPRFATEWLEEGRPASA
jgi:mannose-6-phosphate isomerase-like protein (cupin superfamily)